MKSLPLLWRQGPLKWPKMVRKSPKKPENSIKWLFGSKNVHGQSFVGGKTDDRVKNSKFWNLDHFCDVTDPQIDPKWPIMARKSPKMPENSIKWLFGSKNEHGQCFWGGKTDDHVKNLKF